MKTTLQVTLECRDMLKHIGRKDESYEDVIRRLIKEAGYNNERE